MELRLLSAVCTAIYIYSNAAMAVSFTPLGDLPGGGFDSSANGVSADGSVAVGESYSDSGREEFRWIRESGMQSVASILTRSVDLTGWTLERATGVSADGYTIVEFGTNPDDVGEAWNADLTVAPSATTQVDLSGTIKTPDGTDICAMVLASGQYTFSCDPPGVFSLTGLPRNADGTVKRQIYAHGFFPKIDILADSTNESLVMTRSGVCPDYNLPYEPAFVPGSAGKEIYIAGEVLLQNSQTPICAMVLANGQYMFSCDGSGSYFLKIPLDNNGQFKLQVYADGFAPSIRTFDEFKTTNIVRMARAVECHSDCGTPDEFDWRDTVMYYAMVDRFFDSDGVSDPVAGVSDGDARIESSAQYEGGDIPGLTLQLDYLLDLGISALLLSAPYENRNEAGAAGLPEEDPHLYSAYHGLWPSPANIDFGDPTNPFPVPQVESRIGTAADLNELVSSAHARTTANGSSMKVLFDYMTNHVDVASGLYGARPDWFVHADGGGFRLCGPENLWDDPFWATRCAFTDYLAPFDFYNSDARAWSISDALWWAKTFETDGYRLHAVRNVPTTWLTDLRTALTNEELGPGGHFYLVGETFGDRTVIKFFIDPHTKLDGQLDFWLRLELCEAVFQPEGSLSGLAAYMETNDRYYDAAANAPALMTTWIGNQVTPRAIHFASGQLNSCLIFSTPENGWDSSSYIQPSDAAPYERLGIAFVILMTNPGIPLLYCGDEVGLSGGGDPDNRRLMPSDIDLNVHQIILREQIRRLALIRGQHKVLGRGKRTTLDSDSDTWVYRMGGCGAGFNELIVAINRSDADRVVLLPKGPFMDLLGGRSISGGDYTLAGRSAVILIEQ